MKRYLPLNAQTSLQFFQLFLWQELIGLGNLKQMLLGSCLKKILRYNYNFMLSSTFYCFCVNFFLAFLSVPEDVRKKVLDSNFNSLQLSF
jgi:hypothetical protein